MRAIPKLSQMEISPLEGLKTKMNNFWLLRNKMHCFGYNNLKSFTPYAWNSIQTVIRRRSGTQLVRNIFTIMVSVVNVPIFSPSWWHWWRCLCCLYTASHVWKSRLSGIPGRWHPARDTRWDSLVINTLQSCNPSLVFIILLTISVRSPQMYHWSEFKKELQYLN